MSNTNQVSIIGAGFSGLSSACYLAKKGIKVDIYEKHNIPGGRARQFKTDNDFVFDMGPSWYWMPDVLEKFFNDFGYTTADFYELVELNPQFEIVFKDHSVSLPKDFEEMKILFEKIEKGSSEKLVKFMNIAKEKYSLSMDEFIEKPCLSWFEFINIKIITGALKTDILSDFRSYVKKFFKNPDLITIMEFPVIFLGASPTKIPALYSLMNYGGYKLGTWYPIGGFYQIILAMEKIAKSLGVNIHYNSNLEKINIKNHKVDSILINQQEIKVSQLISSADYHFTEQKLDFKYRNYTEDYWKSRTFAPSCLIFYLGIDQAIPNLKHHTLFFENDLDLHIDEIYTSKKWPEKPLFYVCTPSKTDKLVAPEGKENLFLLMPLAIGIEDNENIRDMYFDIMIKRIENKTGISNLKEKIIYKKSYCVKDFQNDYNAFQGNAYGLANTLNQTAVLKPSIKNKKINNLYYTGQLTVPGPGVPPSIISGKIVAQQIINQNQK